MARPARPLWLVRPSRASGLSANQAVALVLFLLLPPLTLTAAESDELVARISDLVEDFLKAEGVVAA